jgi:hypothetical protein
LNPDPLHFDFLSLMSKYDAKGAKTMQIKANGILMNYELSGKADASVVMLSHSLGSSLAMWNPWNRATRSCATTRAGTAVVMHRRVHTP